MPDLCTSRSSGITDRAKRYRAQNCNEQGEKVCLWCGARKNLMVAHVNGNEGDSSPENLGYSCRPCNTSVGIFMARAGYGKRTAQYNPAGGAVSVGQWLTAVMSMKGQGPMSLAAAVDMVRSTSQAKRSEFAKEIWALRKRRGTVKVGVPF